MTLTQAGSFPAATITATGSDNNGNFVAEGNVFGHGFAVDFGGPGSPSTSGIIVWGYYDSQLGLKGAILLTSFQGGSATSCPSGVPIYNGSCLVAILAKQ